MGGLSDRLSGVRCCGLDTCVFIYHLENHPLYAPLTREILGAVESGIWLGYTTVISLTELLVRPWQLGERQKAMEYEGLLCSFPHLRVLDINRQIARLAARLRGEYQVRAADALQVAGAITNGAEVFITNDKALRRLDPLISILVLVDYICPDK
ncbi:MAG: type II toxin-antitoxin system VapC family toxin [Anaerolineae bacterium]